MHRLFPLLLLLGLACQSPSPDYLDESTVARDARLAWWRDARLGLFIHWGPYAVPAGTYAGRDVPGASEWIMHTARIAKPAYEAFARDFDPEAYDAEAWVRSAKAAGMRYLVITAKHHDGFCLWDSEVGGYNAVQTAAAGRDLLAALRDACRRQGLRFGLYYSIMDWHHPDAQGHQVPGSAERPPNPHFTRYLETYLKPQVRELITRYDPDILWFDGEWIPEYTHEMGLDLYQYARTLKPELLINNRVDKGRQGMQGMNRAGARYAGDFGTPEQEVLSNGLALDWETCMTMNDSWGYKARDTNWKSPQVLVHHLVDIAAKGGNYLLNVGPDAQGRIPDASLKRLSALGRWLDVNGEAIYGSQLWSYWEEGTSIRYLGDRYDSSRVYVALLQWPGDTLTLRRVQPVPGSSIHLLGDSVPLAWHFDPETGLRVGLPPAERDRATRLDASAWVLRLTAQPSHLLPAPHIGAASLDSLTQAIFRDTAWVRLTSSYPDAALHYTLDGRTPTRQSPRYTAPFALTKPASVRAVAFAAGWVSSPAAEAHFQQGRFQDLHLAYPHSRTYPGSGRLALIDGRRAGADFHDPAWQGFEGDDLVLTLDLGRLDTISHIAITFLNQQSDWIFLPPEVNFEVSATGSSYHELSSFALNLGPDDPGPRIHPFVLRFPPERVRYVRIRAHNVGTCPPWHPGAGGKAWLFADEVEVEVRGQKSEVRGQGSEVREEKREQNR